MKVRHFGLGLFTSSLVLLAGIGGAQAQSYPSKRITMIIPYPPTSVAYVLGKLLGDELQKRWGQPVVADSRVGAGGIVGYQAALFAPADGYTLIYLSTANTATPVFAKNQGVDPEKDFITVASEAYTPYFLVMSGALPLNNMREVIAYAKANPGKLNLAMHNNTWSHLSSLEIMAKFGIDMTMVPYAGGATAMQAMLVNEAQLYTAGTLFGMADHIKSGRLKVLAILDDKRFPVYPDYPTMGSQTGVEMRNVAHTITQVRTGTPQPMVDKLAATIAEIYSDPVAADRVRKLAFEPSIQLQTEATRTVQRAYEHAREIARVAKLPVP